MESVSVRELSASRGVLTITDLRHGIRDRAGRGRVPVEVVRVVASESGASDSREGKDCSAHLDGCVRYYCSGSRSLSRRRFKTGARSISRRWLASVLGFEWRSVECVKRMSKFRNRFTSNAVFLL